MAQHLRSSRKEVLPLLSVLVSHVTGPAGTQHMRLRVCKNKQSPIDVVAMDLPPLTLTPSALVVSSIEVEAVTSVVAGNMLPPIW